MLQGSTDPAPIVAKVLRPNQEDIKGPQTWSPKLRYLAAMMACRQEGSTDPRSLSDEDKLRNVALGVTMEWLP